MVGLPGTAPGPDIEALCREGVRAFILFARNCPDMESIRATTERLQELTGGEAIIAVDHEGGRVNRFGALGIDWPSQMAVAATGDPQLAQALAVYGGLLLGHLGITVNFAPVLDILDEPRNPIISTRAFSDDPKTVGAFGSAVVAGYSRAGIATVGKHFPGHGATPTDSHVDLPIIDRSAAELLAHDVVPFVEAIRGGLPALMTSHVWYSALERETTSATMSHRVMRMAREDLEFVGVIFSDCMEMEAIQKRMSTGDAVVRTLAAGSDMPIVSHRLDRQRDAIGAVAAAIDSGLLPRRRVQEAVDRVSALHGRFRPRALTNWPDVDILEKVARRAVTTIRGENPLLLPDGADLHILVTTGTASAERRAAVMSTLAPQVEGRARVRSISPDWASRVREEIPNREPTIVITAGVLRAPWQAELIRSLVAGGSPVAAVAVEDPYDALLLEAVPTVVAAFDDSPMSLHSALEVVLGRASANGSLPVVLPTAIPVEWTIGSHTTASTEGTPGPW